MYIRLPLGRGFSMNVTAGRAVYKGEGGGHSQNLSGCAMVGKDVKPRGKEGRRWRQGDGGQGLRWPLRC